MINLFFFRLIRQEEANWQAEVNQGFHLPKEKKVEAEPVVKVPRHLVPEDPSKYGIVAIPESRMPHEQMEWDLRFENIIQDSGILDTAQGKKAVEKMSTSEEKFQDTRQKIDKEITSLEKQRQDNPISEDVERHLQNLYKLKALSKVLERRVVTLHPPEPRDK